MPLTEADRAALAEMKARATPEQAAALEQVADDRSERVKAILRGIQERTGIR